MAYLAQNKLEPLGLVTRNQNGSETRTTPKAAPILAMAGRGFLPASVVRPIAWGLRPLFFPPVMGLFLVAMVLTDVWAFATQPVLNSLGLMLLHPALMLGALGLLGLDTLWHEFGHATACRKGGAKPGRIGAGVYLMFPAFFTDVTSSYALNRRSRLLVDLGGVYFNATFISALGLAWHFTGYAPVLVVLAFSNLTIIQQLMPVVRFDGYWVLSDLVGVPDLFARIKPALSSVVHRKAQTDLTRKALVIVSVWVAVIVPLLLGGMAVMVLRMPSFLETTWHSLAGYYGTARVDITEHQWTALALAVLMIMFLLLPTVGLTVLAVRSTKAVGGLLRSRRRRHTPLSTSGLSWTRRATCSACWSRARSPCAFTPCGTFHTTPRPGRSAARPSPHGPPLAVGSGGIWSQSVDRRRNCLGQPGRVPHSQGGFPLFVVAVENRRELALTLLLGQAASEALDEHVRPHQRLAH